MARLLYIREDFCLFSSSQLFSIQFSGASLTRSCHRLALGCLWFLLGASTSMTSVLFSIVNRCYDRQTFSQRLAGVLRFFCVWLSQSAQSCTTVSILECCTARMLLLFESLDCMGMCYLVFNI